MTETEQGRAADVATRLLKERKLSNWQAGFCQGTRAVVTGQVLWEVLTRLCVEHDLNFEPNNENKTHKVTHQSD
jgi:hypothetical protein